MNNQYCACPSCNSEDVYFSKKRNCFVCEDCGATFLNATPQKHANNIFFSYGHDANRPIVDRLKNDLEAIGYSVWIDYEKIAQGDDWRSAIVNGVASSDMVLAFLSSHATRTNGVCRDELRIALCERCAYIQPVLLESQDSFTPPQNITERQWIDMSEWHSFDMHSPNFEDWYAKKFQELVNVLRSRDVSDLRGDITTLKEILNPELISPKEVALLKKDFVGRQWLFNVLENEKASSARCIHIIGGAGTGKSAISAHAQYYMDNIIGTWYCRWDEYKTTEAVSFLKTLAFKLSVCIEEYRRYILSYAEEIAVALSSQNVSEIIEKLIVLPMQYTIDGNRDCKFFVIDGLDEAERNKQNEILNVLCTIIPAIPAWLKFVITSRESTAIAHRLKLFDICKIELDKAPESQSDFDYYCANRLGLDCGKTKAFNGNYLLAELCNKSRDSVSSEIDSLGSYYFQSFTKQFGDKDYTQNERTTLSLLLNAVSPIPVEMLLLIYDRDEDEYIRSIRKIKEFTVDSTEVFQTFWYKRTISISHYSLQQWLLSKEAGKYQITKKDSIKVVLEFYENLIRGHSFYLTTSIIDNFETFLLKNGYYDLLHQKKQDSHYLMIKERLRISDNYSNDYSTIAHLDAEKIRHLNDLSHKISLASHPIRYHAAKPLLHHGGGAMDDYCEYYIFPCCRHYLASDGIPHTVAESGCRVHFGEAKDLPASVELTNEEKFQFWKNELMLEFRRQATEYQRIYDQIYNRTVADSAKWNTLLPEEKEQVLTAVQNTAKLTAYHTAEYRTSNITSHLKALAKTLGVSQSDLELCIEECKRIGELL